jgi:hypothetical protein
VSHVTHGTAFTKLRTGVIHDMGVRAQEQRAEQLSSAISAMRTPNKAKALLFVFLYQMTGTVTAH